MAVPISNVTRRVVFAASGTGPYSFTFEILAETDVAVYEDDTLLTLTTDYSVTINANGTGYITLVSSPTGSQIAVVGDRAIERTSDFVTGGDFFANTVNRELDSLTIFSQQNAESIDRALKAPQTDPTTVDMTLPRSTVRANKTLAFDASGNPTTGEVVGDNRGTWAASTSYAKRDIVKDSTNQNIYYANTAHTSSGALPISTNTDAAKWDLLVDAVAPGAAQAAAEAAQAAAEAAQTAAETAETNAASSASAASTSASNAATSASNASTSATSASGSASAASTSAGSASTSATSASTSASAAATSASNASTSATAASGSATNAANSASAASTSASNASTSATNAANSATTAGTHATNAANSATDSANSATASANSATAAAASAAAAAASFDAFDDIYLGAKASDPTVDNDGDPLTTGDQYFNTGANELRVYNGSTWQAASTVGGTVASLNVTGATTLGQNPTLSGGTANGVTYLNGSKVLTSGSALTFDGTNFSATGTTTVNSANSSQVSLVVKGETGNGIRQNFIGQASSGQYNWQIGASITAAGYFAIIPSTAVDGTTFSTAAYSITGTGTSIWAVAGSEGMRLTSTGLGIGTSSPSDKLHVSGNVRADYFRPASNQTDPNDGSAYIYQQSGVGWDFAALNLKFSTGVSSGRSESMRITSAGNVGIGTSSPSYKLQVQGSAASDVELLSLHNSDDSSSGVSSSIIGRVGTSSVNSVSKISFVRTASAYHAGAMTFSTRDGSGGGMLERMRINSSGNVGIGTTSPAARLDVSSEIRVTSGSNIGRFLTDGSNFYVGTRSNIPMRFETNSTTQMIVDTSGNFQFNSGYGSVATAYGCRAWVNFNGTGTVAIRASGNVSSITDNGTGEYTVNFSTAMTDANYTPVMSGGYGADQNHYLYPAVSNVSAPTASSFRIYNAWPFSPWKGDGNYVTVAIFR